MAKEMLLGVADVLILDNDTGLQIASATLSSHTIEQTVDSTDLRGGRTNKLIGRLKTNKSLTVTVEDLQQTKEMQALISGAEIKADGTVITKGASVAYTMPKTVKYTAGANGIVLDVTKPHKAGTPIYVYNALTGEKYAENVIETVPGGGGAVTSVKIYKADNKQDELDEGTEVIVGAYAYTVADAPNFTIKSNKFAKNVSVILEEDVYDGETMEIIKVKQTIIPLASPDENFSLSGSAEISETTASYTFTALATKEDGSDCENLLGYVVYVDPDVTC